MNKSAQKEVGCFKKSGSFFCRNHGYFNTGCFLLILFLIIFPANTPYLISASSPATDFVFDPSLSKITGYAGTGGDVVIPSQIGNTAVTVIGELAFAPNHNIDPFSCNRITSIIISEGITSIEKFAFSYCQSLKSVTIPSSVTSIEGLGDAFLGSNSLERIDVDINNPVYGSISGILYKKRNIENTPFSISTTTPTQAQTTPPTHTPSPTQLPTPTATSIPAPAETGSLGSTPTPKDTPMKNITHFPTRTILLPGPTIEYSLSETDDFLTEPDTGNDINSENGSLETNVLTSTPGTNTSTPDPTITSTALQSQNPADRNEITARPTFTLVRSKFTDIKEKYWAKTYIEYLVSRGMLSGKAPGKFFPEDFTTRAECAKVISMVFAKSSSEITYTSNFTDVQNEDWCYPYISQLCETKIMRGYPDGSFRPDSAITRQEISVIFARVMEQYCNKPQIIEAAATDFLQGKFSDFNSISRYAVDGVMSCVNYGVINGKTKKMPNREPQRLFDPNGNTKRGELASIVYKILLMAK